MSRLSRTTGLRLGRTIADWQGQLRILQRIRETLKQFRPTVYDRPVTDLIAATATGGVAPRKRHRNEQYAALPPAPRR